MADGGIGLAFETVGVSTLRTVVIGAAVSVFTGGAPQRIKSADNAVGSDSWTGYTDSIAGDVATATDCAVWIICHTIGAKSLAAGHTDGGRCIDTIVGGTGCGLAWCANAAITWAYLALLVRTWHTRFIFRHPVGVQTLFADLHIVGATGAVRDTTQHTIAPHCVVPVCALQAHSDVTRAVPAIGISAVCAKCPRCDPVPQRAVYAPSRTSLAAQAVLRLARRALHVVVYHPVAQLASHASRRVVCAPQAICDIAFGASIGFVDSTFHGTVGAGLVVVGTINALGGLAALAGESGQINTPSGTPTNSWY